MKRSVRRMTIGNSGAGGLGASREMLPARLKIQPATDIGRWTRDELYENEPVGIPGGGTSSGTALPE
jgi:hypothetical protein